MDKLKMRRILKAAVILINALLQVWWCGICSAASQVDRPNILWITAEDMSPTLGCYGDDFAATPHIDKLATQSVRYTRAFATAPVCSPSRSCLITGVVATSLGTHQMRSALALPETIRGFPSLLRNAGYYTTNNVKTDYNTSSASRLIKESWNESSNQAHWRRRTDKNQPFFSVFNIMTSHQSRSMVWTQKRFRDEVQSLLSQENVHDPDEAPVPAYYPKNLVSQRIMARYYDCVSAMDQQVGSILQQLEDDGLAEQTIVFFYSDHGSGMPRHKRLLHESGLHVPLLIRFPPKFSHLAPADPGEACDQLVSFVDFPPTVLKLAGVAATSYMQGLPFLDNDNVQREHVFGHRDRIDEVIDLSRSVRDHRYLYIRNYMPHLGWNQFSAYPDMSEIRHEIYRLAERGDMTSAQQHYAAETKPVEELYDCEQDLDNLKNLATSRQHKEILNRMRRALQREIQQTGDRGFVPEIRMRELFANSAPHNRNHMAAEEEVTAAAAAAHSLPDLDDYGIRELLANDRFPSVRYWGAIGLATKNKLTRSARNMLVTALDDPSVPVRIEAASALARHGEIDQALPILLSLLEHEDLTVVMYATRAIELIGKGARSAIPAMKRVAKRADKLQASDTPAVFAQSGEKDLAMFCSFSAHGFLDRVSKGKWQLLSSADAKSDWQNSENHGVAFDATDHEIRMLSKGKNLWIVHHEEFDDFELTAEAKMPVDEYNAGIGFRCDMRPHGRPIGYQCEVAEELSGMLFAIGSGGWVWPKGDQQRQQFFKNVGAAFRSSRWNHFRIRCEGSRIQIWVNGILATDVEDEKHRKGRIALQHHGKGGPHFYRKVYIRRLSEDN